MTRPVVACREVSVDYGTVRALDHVTLDIFPGETIAVLGPSGSGKTSLIYAIAGLVPISTGELDIDGDPVSTRSGSVPPEDRIVGMVFQNYALWPHLDAADTVAYPYRRAGIKKAEARRRAQELLDRLEIGELAERKPHELSGGQQQRVGLARALAREARVYLFDEPTAHLDATNRLAAQEEIGRRRRELDAAAIYATHDAAEALAIADRVAILRAGKLVQVGTPLDIYERPADIWAARLTGPASILESKLIRPDWVEPGGRLVGKVSEVWYRGSVTDYRVETESGSLEIRLAGPPRFNEGDETNWTVTQSWTMPESGR